MHNGNDLIMFVRAIFLIIVAAGAYNWFYYVRVSRARSHLGLELPIGISFLLKTGIFLALISFLVVASTLILG